MAPALFACPSDTLRCISTVPIITISLKSTLCCHVGISKLKYFQKNLLSFTLAELIHSNFIYCCDNQDYPISQTVQQPQEQLKNSYDNREERDIERLKTTWHIVRTVRVEILNKCFMGHIHLTNMFCLSLIMLIYIMFLFGFICCCY